MGVGEISMAAMALAAVAGVWVVETGSEGRGTRMFFDRTIYFFPNVFGGYWVVGEPPGVVGPGELGMEWVSLVGEPQGVVGRGELGMEWVSPVQVVEEASRHQ
ncbi:hypothetical protein HanHA300_Chr15g0580751 [Helianthus annuus]|nr:hypothetical protein HanHA300_Chr15g0580751 [Helianthus annuus]KAJ0474509.1 hypothetical protein HanHA89_Chr15g0630471 [Helianthus annuus]KAJ0650067.1 hypothetical protein HanLR1_Chr15g0591401 [Helianthus annuus]